MGETSPTSSRIGFGNFEVDLAAGQLYKNGRLTRLPEQSFQVLIALLERPGEVVTREELREKLWADQTYVDFDQGLNNAINRLRDALGDSAANPRFIETLHRRGYRFTHLLVKRDEPAPPPPSRPTFREVVASHAPLVLATAILSVALTLFIQRTVEAPEESPPEPPSDRFSFEVSDLQFAHIGEPLVQVSPDGREVAYVGKDGFWVRDLSELSPRPLAGTEGAGRFAWSPDSTAIAFLSKGAIRRIPVRGGGPVTLWESESIFPSGAVSWSTDGNVLRFVGALPSAGMLEVSANGGLPRASPLPHDLFSSELPRTFSAFDPDWIHVKGFYLHEREITWGEKHGEDLQVLARGWSPWYSSGHLLFTSLGPPRGIWAVPLSKRRREAGEAFLVEQANLMSMSVTNEGTLVYAVNPVEQARLLLLNREGELVGVAGAPQAGMGRPEFSPDGRRVAVWGFEYESAWDVWVHEVDSPRKTRLSRNDGVDIQPVWSPDGTRIAFTSDRASGSGPQAARDLYVRSVDSNKEEELFAQDAFVWDWSENGDYILTLLRQDGKQFPGDIGYLEIKGQSPYEVKPLRKTKHDESHAVFSPDSRYVAFVSNDTGKLEVYVCSFPDCLKEKRVSTNGGAFPRWARRQGSLYYLQDEDTLMEVKITTQPDLDIGKPQPLFTHPSLAFPGYTATRKYDVSEDGERFIVVEDGMERISKENPAVIHVWRNWHAKFKTRR